MPAPDIEQLRQRVRRSWIIDYGAYAAAFALGTVGAVEVESLWLASALGTFLILDLAWLVAGLMVLSHLDADGVMRVARRLDRR